MQLHDVLSHPLDEAIVVIVDHIDRLFLFFKRDAVNDHLMQVRVMVVDLSIGTNHFVDLYLEFLFFVDGEHSADDQLVDVLHE